MFIKKTDQSEYNFKSCISEFHFLHLIDIILRIILKNTKAPAFQRVQNSIYKGKQNKDCKAYYVYNSKDTKEFQNFCIFVSQIKLKSNKTCQ